MAEVPSGKTNDSEEFNEDDLDEDEHLYQFTINFGGGSAGPSAAASELDQYTSSDDEKSSSLPKKATRLRKPKPTVTSVTATPSATLSQAPAPISQEDPLQEEAMVSEVMTYAKAISLVDWGSIAHIKHGTAGASAEKDKFPFFNPTLKHWIYLAWDDHPREWVFLLLDKRQDEYEGDFDQVPSENKIYLRDITEVYLELAPSVSFRVYLSAHPENQLIASEGEDGNIEGGVDAGVGAAAVGADNASTTDTSTQSISARNIAQGGAKAPVVLKITPVPNVRGHAAMWVDALFSAMQLQCFEPEEEVLEVKARFYEALQATNAATGEGDNLIVLDEGRQSSVNLGSDESNPRSGSERGSMSDLEAGRKRPVSGTVHYGDVYGSGARNRDGSGAKDAKSCCIVC